MAAFLYRCPNTGQHVQGWSAKEVRADETSYRHLHRVPTGASRESRNRPIGGLRQNSLSRRRF
jgi:hypothetical protein